MGLSIGATVSARGMIRYDLWYVGEIPDKYGHWIGKATLLTIQITTPNSMMIMKRKRSN